MEILITNDDGWGSKGILTLTRLLKSMGHVTVIAPDGARSGQAAAISVQKPMYLRPVKNTDPSFQGVDIYTTNGTPADCVKMAINVIFGGDDKKIGLVASGINHGSNAAINVMYSGTMGACMVAAEHGIPAIGYSLDDHDPEADFSHFAKYIPDLTQHLLDEGFPYGICYNINAPKGELEGVQWTRQCLGHWEKELEEHKDQNGDTYYILVGNFVNHEPDALDTDMNAMGHRQISICPTTIDYTAHQLL